MKGQKSDLNRAFTRAHDQTPKQTAKQAELTGSIKRDRPAPYPRPPALGQSVDAAYFDRQWQKDAQGFENQARQKLHNNAQIVKRSGLKLADRFNQIESRARHRNQDKGRSR